MPEITKTRLNYGILNIIKGYYFVDILTAYSVINKSIKMKSINMYMYEGYS